MKYWKAIAKDINTHPRMQIVEGDTQEEAQMNAEIVFDGKEIDTLTPLLPDATGTIFAGDPAPAYRGAAVSTAQNLRRA